MSRTRLTLSLECLILFGLLPAGLMVLQRQGGFPFFPVLFALLGLTLLIAWRDPAVHFRPAAPGGGSIRLGLRVCLAAAALTALTLWLAPERLFGLPRERPVLWLLILVLYPLLSVAPQEFLFRTFFMQRYRPVFGDRTAMLLANAALFGWAHIFFLNWIAPALSALGGLLLAHTWQRTHSFRLVCLEHALYGQLVFTTGIGWFFYTGSARALQTLTPP